MPEKEILTIQGQNEIVMGSDGKPAQFVGQTPYAPRSLQTSVNHQITPDTGSIISIDGGAGLPVAGHGLQNQYMPMGRTQVEGGVLIAETYFTRSYESMLQYALNGSQFATTEAANARMQISKLFDEVSILGLGELEWYDNNTKRTPNSVMAKAGKLDGTDAISIRKAVNKLHRNNPAAKPIIMVEDPYMLEMENLIAVPGVPGLFQMATMGALVATMPQLGMIAAEKDMDEAPVLIYDANIFHTAYYNGFISDIITGGYDQVEAFRGNTGKGKPNDPASSVGFSHNANGKVELRLMTWFDYNYLGNDTTAFTNIPKK